MKHCIEYGGNRIVTQDFVPDKNAPPFRGRVYIASRAVVAAMAKWLPTDKEKG